MPRKKIVKPEVKQEKKKTGILSEVDRKFIFDNQDKMTKEEMSQVLKKNEKVIEKEIRQYMKLPVGENKSTRWHLKHLAEWKHLKEQFSLDELNLVEEKYVKYVEQMKDNITATEESQVLNMIKIEILMDRNLKRQMALVNDIERCQKECEALYASYGGDWTLIPKEDRDHIQRLNDRMESAKNGAGSRVDQHLNLQKELNNIHQKLKTSRDQRIGQVLDAKTSFGEYLKQLLNKEKQQLESRRIELYKIAVKKDHKRLSAAHKFADGNYDNPILTVDILEELDLEDAKEKLLEEKTLPQIEYIKNESEDNFDENNLDGDIDD